MEVGLIIKKEKTMKPPRPQQYMLFMLLKTTVGRSTAIIGYYFLFLMEYNVFKMQSIHFEEKTVIPALRGFKSQSKRTVEIKMH